MSEEREENAPSRATLNTQRLSAMIDSLNNEKDDRLFQSPTTTSTMIPDEKGYQSNVFKPPSRLLRSPAGDVSLPTGDNRSSMISNYSGVIQEGVEVSYIVKNQQQGGERRTSKDSSSLSSLKQPVSREDLPMLPMLPSEATLTKHLSDNQSPNSKTDGDEIIIKPVTNAKPVGRFNSNTSKKVENRGSLKLLSSPRRQEKDMRSSIGSGNLASESGSSSYNAKFHQSIQEQLEEEEEANASDKLSIVSSVIPDLSTKTNEVPKEMNPIRSETNDYNPTIPPRSKDRPRSRLFIQEDDGEGDFLNEEILSTPVSTAGHYKNPSQISTVSEQKSESYYSAATSMPPEEDTYLTRPLPSTPNEDCRDTSGLKRDDTLKAIHDRTKHISSTTNELDDDKYEDIIEETPKKAKLKKDAKKKLDKKKSVKELRSFDIDTLNQLLSVTKGTLIGSEFAQLGMKIEEKRALERLVDSLSRLTADMVLDPDRYEEGLKRLDKATKALEGF
ncbi:Nba1p [Saccharomyces paradoxus]|uniref:Nba1p n=1 Tax=Saccharomyces paradoxus TaxID=27291 RepID=A0A8B8UZE5_SACPA|nr:Nba1 [Saccharomyces paradoxus]QHS76054.1 Nba1 [Saccharomyces paradoxus]